MVTILNLDLINPRLSLGLEMVIELRTTVVQQPTEIRHIHQFSTAFPIN